MTTIQIRIDTKTKNKAKKIFKELGIDMSTGIKLFLTQVALRKKIPFEPLTENGLTEKQEDEILKASEEAKRGINVDGPFTPEEFIEDLHN